MKRDNDGSIFEKHIEQMKVFGQVHAFVADGSNLRDERVIPLNTQQTLFFSHTISPTGGLKVVVSPEGWQDLIVMWQVSPRRFSQS